MNLTFDGEFVRAGNQARERFYDSRGYGRPKGGELVLAPVEAAHLLYRGDVEAIGGADGQTLGFHDFLASRAVSEVEFFVYKDLRDRGFYLSHGDNVEGDVDRDFLVYPRGKGPWDERVAYRIEVVGERTDVTAQQLQSLATIENGTGVLAVVDEESEVTYLEVGERVVSGSTSHEIPPLKGELLADRVLVWEPPAVLYERGFYGQRLDQEGDPVQLSLIEAASLAGEDILDIEAETGGSVQAIIERGRAVEGERFDRRLRVYNTLREVGVVPKTGFKFGADFRTYADVESVDDLGHSELLVRVLPADHTFNPRDLALDVRLAHGVRKTMVFALVDGETISWLSVTRLTP